MVWSGRREMRDEERAAWRQGRAVEVDGQRQAEVERRWRVDMVEGH